MSSCAVRWESGVPKCITLYDQMGEQWCYVMTEPLLTVPVLNVSVGLFHALSVERTGITLDSM